MRLDSHTAPRREIQMSMWRAACRTNSEGALVHSRIRSTISGYRIREALVLVLFFQVSRPWKSNEHASASEIRLRIMYVIHPTSANVETKTFCTCTYSSQQALNQHSISGRIREEKPWIIKTISCGYNFRKIAPAQLLFKGLASRCCSRWCRGLQNIGPASHVGYRTSKRARDVPAQSVEGLKNQLWQATSWRTAHHYVCRTVRKYKDLLCIHIETKTDLIFSYILVCSSMLTRHHRNQSKHENDDKVFI